MRFYVFIFCLLSLVTFTRCGQDRSFVKRNLTIDFEIPAALNTIESHYFALKDVNIFYEETLSANGLPIASTYEVSGQRALLSARFGAADFSTIEKISIFAVNKFDRTKRVELFYNEQIPFTSRSELKLLTSIGNFSSFISNNKVDLDVRIKFRGFVPQPISTVITMDYLIYTD